MSHARFNAVATLVVSLVATAAPGQTPPKSSTKIGAPVKGQVDVEYTKPVSKRDKDLVVTTIQVKNISVAPIPRLTIDENWYDKAGSLIAGSRSSINGLFQPGDVQTVKIETPFDPKMYSNTYVFSYANGTINPHSAAKVVASAPKAPDAKPTAAPK